MRIYLVVELYKSGDPPRIVGAFRSKKTAEEIAYDPRCLTWRNVIPMKVN